MENEKNAVPVCETGNGCEQIALEGFETPQANSTTGKNPAQEIACFLLRGSVNAIPLRDLQRLTGLDGRTIRRKILVERRHGGCICEDNKSGYFIAENVRERDACAASMRHRAKEIRKTADAIAAAEVPDG